MARGRAPGYDAQRETILNQAAELFARQGFVGTSMNEVATACGMSKPALYHYVRDKSQLLFEIATTHVARLHALIDEVAAGDQRVAKAGHGLALLELAAEQFRLLQPRADIPDQVCRVCRQAASNQHQQQDKASHQVIHGATPSRCHSTGGQTYSICRVSMLTATWMV